MEKINYLRLLIFFLKEKNIYVLLHNACIKHNMNYNFMLKTITSLFEPMEWLDYLPTNMFDDTNMSPVERREFDYACIDWKFLCLECDIEIFPKVKRDLCNALVDFYYRISDEELEECLLGKLNETQRVLYGKYKVRYNTLQRRKQFNLN